MVPRATYRLQFGKNFGFADAAAIAPYLAELGTSHVYASPYVRARPGSEHGYDIIDHNELNPELGDHAAFQGMLDAFRDHGLRQILDYVPNHMGVGGADNPLWLDLLEFGKNSPYAVWFDVEWNAQPGYFENRLLVPFLGRQYGRVLEEGQVELRLDAEAGEFSVWLYDTHRLPVAPETYSEILNRDVEELAKLALKFDSLPSATAAMRERVRKLKDELAESIRSDEEMHNAILASLKRFRGETGELRSWNALDALIQRQHWRPAHFRVAADDINYRRFFNINELAGIRMELPEVFAHSHRLVMDLLKRGELHGLRIDHVDGLYDPKEYLMRLHEDAGDQLYVVVEKILESHEELRSDWPVAGTTGYDFCGAVTGLFVDPSAEWIITRFYREFTGEQKNFAEVTHECKLKILDNEMAGELNSLARAALRIARQDPRTQDFTQNILRRALREIVACFPVYRTYVNGSGAQESDERYIHWAVALAQKNEQELDPSVFGFLEELLQGRASEDADGYVQAASVKRFAMKAQQFSGPVMAKGLEDTALYRYNRFVALNEVGSSAMEFGVPVAAFHKQNQARAEKWPHSLLATSTHDTKRGEDARARLAALSLVPEEWSTRVTAWSRLLRARRGDIERTGPPAANDEYLVYQNLVASWPAELVSSLSAALNPTLLSDYTERLVQATIKSLREARERSTWVAPELKYEEAVAQFVRDALNPQISSTFLESFLPFVGQIAQMGFHNSLVQLALKATAPGVPDFYQGSELWNLSLMDPDNRRPVDFGLRRRLLGELRRQSCNSSQETCFREVLECWPDGRIKLAVTSVLLKFRTDHAALLANGNYEPLSTPEEASGRTCAFWRRTETETCLTIVSLDARLAAEDWAEKQITIEPATAARWRDVLTKRVLICEDNQLKLKDVFAVLPAAVLIPFAAG